MTTFLKLHNSSSATSFESMRSRDRFTDNIKVYDPSLKTDNYGKHSPAAIYSYREVPQRLITTHRIKRENASFSFSKAIRGYEDSAKKIKDK